MQRQSGAARSRRSSSRRVVSAPGFDLVTVRASRQQLDDGNVRVAVSEGRTHPSETPARPARSEAGSMQLRRV